MTRKLFDRVLHREAFERLASDPLALRKLQGNTPPALPDLLSRWLGQKLIFEGIPFDYLVADDQLLPNESVRFFSIDANWQFALIDGACSIGRIGSFDTNLDKAFMFTSGGYLAQARASASISGTAMSGFLLRSQAVRGYWPGIRVEGFADAAATQRLTALRMECLTTSVLLVLFDGSLARVDIHEPPEGLHFGLEGPDHLNPALMQRTLRYLMADGLNVPGDPMDKTDPRNRVTVQNDVQDTTYLRSNGVLKANVLAPFIQQALIARHATPASGSYTSAEFSLEMIEGVDLVTYTAPPSTKVVP